MSHVGIAEVVVVRIGDAAARGWSCSILVVAEAVQEINATVKRRKLSLNIVYERDEDNYVGYWNSCSEGVHKAGIDRTEVLHQASIYMSFI